MHAELRRLPDVVSERRHDVWRERPVDVWVEAVALMQDDGRRARVLVQLRENALFLSSLCLSRACLGKVMLSTSTIKSGQKDSFLTSAGVLGTH